MAREDRQISFSGKPEMYCNVKLDSLLKLKDSTKKLLYLLEEIQSKTRTSIIIPDASPNISGLIKPIPLTSNITESIDVEALKQLEDQTQYLDEICIENELDDCSVFKRLTRKCHCLNHKEYNDFIIHFNEDTKYCTSTLGEIIKNIRILKKFLYMGGGYTKNALLFLNEGLSDSPHNEKVEITLACSHADICNVFDDNSLITVCIAWPCKYEEVGDTMTQALAAGLLYKLAQVEEGRRYLNFSSKIGNDIKRIIRKKSGKLNYDTLESLNSTLNLLNPPLARHINITYYCKAQEGMGNRTLMALAQYRLYMTLEEVLIHLDLIHHLSKHDSGVQELRQYLPNISSLFKHLLMEYDNSEMNILITHILNNLVSKNDVKVKEQIQPRAFVVADMATEPIQLKHAVNQIPSRRNIKKTSRMLNKSKIGSLGISPIKKHPISILKNKSAEWELNTQVTNMPRRTTKELRRSIILVPVDKK